MADNQIFAIPAGGGAVDALSLETGEGQLVVTTEARTLGGQTFVDDILYISHDGGVTAFDTTRGEVWWQRSTGLGQPRHNPLVLDDWVLVPNEQLGVYDAETSEVLFRYDGHGSGPLAATTDQFFWLDGRTIRAFSVEDGSQTWARQIQSDVYLTGPKSIAITDGTVIGGINHGVAAFDVDTGEPRWTHDLGENQGSQFAVTPGAVYVVRGYDNTVIQKLNTSSGEVMWRHRLPPNDGSGPPIVVGTTVLIMNGNTLIAIDSRSGDVRWERILGDQFPMDPRFDRSPITVAGDQLFVQSADGRVHSFRTEFEPLPQTSTGMVLGGLAGAATVAGVGLLSHLWGGE
ncbi:PQQ-binding-like beta-propeller repeat protein [Haloferax sp. ATB1]|uniref:outer membrane protein assembly factor BamB family protein n=1 Tax=Haloferax sp. ATB1 TaxID=1508454 RepID=UPI0005B213BE|nr:PQQ-binding-like beta-propeller repeat protein [Haloferax sp. ATB1]